VALRDLPRLLRAVARGYPDVHRRQVLEKRHQYQQYLRRRFEPFLERGESIEQVFTARWPSPRLVPLETFVRQVLVVAVTDRAILVMKDRVDPKKIEARLPRQIRLGPLSQGPYSPLSLPGRRIWVHRDFYGDVEAADAAITPGSSERDRHWPS
jgi:hypothetical protein